MLGIQFLYNKDFFFNNNLNSFRDILVNLQDILSCVLVIASILLVVLIVLWGSVLLIGIILPIPVDTRPPKPGSKWQVYDDPTMNGDIPVHGGKLPPLLNPPVPKPPFKQLPNTKRPKGRGR